MSKKRFVYFCAGVQSGKTTFGSLWIMNESQEQGPGDYLIISPTYKMLNQSTQQKFMELVPPRWGELNKAESAFRTIDGRCFFLRSADKPESIEGITAKAIWADEASLMKANIWLMMQGRVSRTQGRILCTFTPISLNWIHRELEKDKERRLRGEDGDIDFIQFRSVDSPYFPKQEYERARRMLTPMQFQLRYEGIFGKAEGLIYADFNSYNICDDFAIPVDWKKAGGIDWGYNNPFVALEGALNPDDVLYIYKEHYADRCLLKQHAEYLNPDISYFADPSGLQETKEMIDMGFDVKPGNNDVDMRIQRINARIRPSTDENRSIRLKVFKSCIHTIDEFSLYRYDKAKEKPVKEDDHCMDTLGYLVLGLDFSGSMASAIEWI
jgi:PBSX family phage terminase large subunit